VRPAPEVFGSLEKSAQGEKANRTPLVVGVVAAAVALAGFLAWKIMNPPPVIPSAAANPTPATTMAANPSPSPAELAPTPAATSIDPKAVEAEVQKQLAARRKELEKTPAAGKNPGPAAAEVPAAPATALPEPTAEPTTPPTAVPVPTPVPTEPPPPTVEAPSPVAAPEKEPELRRGDLVGPGAGVVEPALVSQPRVVYPAIARQQRVEGRVVVLVLVDENGRVVETRLQQGVSQAALNEAVLAGVRTAKFRAGTKNGTPVKMWRPIIVEVKP
jgi:TonB family protein